MSLASTLLDPIRQARWLDRVRATGYAKILAAAYVPLLVIPYLFAIGAEPGSHPSVDFMCFWSAAVLAWRDPASAYHAATQIAFQAQAFHTPGRYLPFVYPPPFLMLIAPLGLLPFAVAYPTWSAATYALFLNSARRLLPGGFWPIAVFPALYLNAVQGQVGALFTGLFGGALVLLDRRPFAAGLLFGALIFKPQLGLLIPIALLAARQWRAILGATLSALALLGTALLLLGPDAYAAFLHSSSTSLDFVQAGSVGWGKLQTVYGALRLAGAPALAAGTAQGLVALVAATIVFLVWRSATDTLSKGAALAAGALLATPYLLDYDLVLMIVPLCWLTRRGLARGFAPWEKLFLLALYLAPLGARAFAVTTGVNPFPLLLMAVMGILTRDILGARRETGSPAPVGF